MNRRISRVATWAAVAILLSGCMSMRTPMTDFATDYNRVIADTRNQMILLNIVRASLREPTHYSTVSQVGGNLRIEGEIGTDINGIIDDIDQDASVGLTVASSPSFQVIPLETSEFANGILRPIEPNVVALFLSQGWNASRLATLLVEGFDCTAGGARHAYVNDPRSNEPGRLTAQHLSSLGFAPVRAAQEDDPPLVTLAIDDSATLGAIRSLGDGYRVTIGHDASGEPRYEVRETVPQRLHLTVSQAGPDACRGASLAPDEYRLRSVEGVIYFLGEAVRAGQPLTDGDQLLFRVSNSPPASGHAIHVRHDGRDWYIGRADGGSDRSLQMITLISQLIALQTSSEALERSPTTLTIN